MADITPADPKQPAYDAVFAYIRSQPDVLPATAVERNAIIWRAVHAALDAAPPAPADRAATPVSQAQVTTLSELTDDLNRRRDMAAARRLATEAAAGVQQPITGEAHPEGCTCGPHQLARFTTPPTGSAAPEEPQ